MIKNVFHKPTSTSEQLPPLVSLEVVDDEQRPVAELCEGHQALGGVEGEGSDPLALVGERHETLALVLGAHLSSK